MGIFVVVVGRFMMIWGVWSVIIKVKVLGLL